MKKERSHRPFVAFIDASSEKVEGMRDKTLQDVYVHLCMCVCVYVCVDADVRAGAIDDGGV